MDRREFIRFAGLTVAVPIGLEAATRQPGTEYLGRKILYGNATDEPQVWCRLTTPRGKIEFPEEVKLLHRFNDRLFAFCDNSVWEIEETENGLQGVNIRTSEIVQTR